MATYNYRCNDETCNVVIEHIQSVHTRLPESLPCPKCGTDCFYVFLVAPGILTSDTMTHKTLDTTIGKDSEARWKNIYERQAKRDKIRQETQEQALTIVGSNEYVPCKGGKLTAVESPRETENK